MGFFEAGDVANLQVVNGDIEKYSSWSSRESEHGVLAVDPEDVEKVEEVDCGTIGMQLISRK